MDGYAYMGVAAIFEFSVLEYCLCACGCLSISIAADLFTNPGERHQAVLEPDVGTRPGGKSAGTFAPAHLSLFTILIITQDAYLTRSSSLKSRSSPLPHIRNAWLH